MKHQRKIFLAVAVVAGGVILALALRPAPVPVSGIVVERSRFTDYVEEEGRTTLRDPFVVSSPIGGYLQRVRLEVGDEVSAGDLLFRLEPAPAPALDPRAREQAAEAAGVARARLEGARSEWEIRGAEARHAEIEFERYGVLRTRGAVSQSEFDRIRTERDRALSAERAAARAVEAARFELRNARALLEVSEGRRVGEEDPVLEARSPESGRVLARHRWQEGVIPAGESILEIGDLEQLEVTVDLLSMDAVRVEEGMRVLLTRWGGERDLEARVRRVEPSGFMRISALGVEEQRVPVRIVLESPREDWVRLGTDYRVEARFVLWDEDDVLQVPSSALVRHDDRWSVFVVANGRAVRRAVETGRRSGLWSQIISGLEPGETVIGRPGDRVEEGVRVNVEIRPYR